MNSTVVQTWIEACFVQLLALMLNIVFSCINNLNFFIPNMNWDSFVHDVTDYSLNPWVSDIRQKRTSRYLLHASNLQNVGERRAKFDIFHSSPANNDGYKIQGYSK